jgi:hypothetical protein
LPFDVEQQNVTEQKSLPYPRAFTHVGISVTDLDRGIAFGNVIEIYSQSSEQMVSNIHRD